MSQVVTVKVAMVLKATERAILIQLDQENLEEKWIPLSLIEGKVPDEGETDVTLDIPRWFAEKEEISCD